MNQALKQATPRTLKREPIQLLDETGQPIDATRACWRIAGISGIVVTGDEGEFSLTHVASTALIQSGFNHRSQAARFASELVYWLTRSGIHVEQLYNAMFEGGSKEVVKAIVSICRNRHMPSSFGALFRDTTIEGLTKASMAGKVDKSLAAELLDHM